LFFSLKENLPEVKPLPDGGGERDQTHHFGYQLYQQQQQHHYQHHQQQQQQQEFRYPNSNYVNRPYPAAFSSAMSSGGDDPRPSTSTGLTRSDTQATETPLSEHEYRLLQESLQGTGHNDR
jgi:hypothetical protein